MADDGPVRSTHPAAKTLRVFGMILFVPSLVMMLAMAALAYANLDPDLTDGAIFIAGVVFPVVLVSVLLITGGSLAERTTRHAWPSAGGWTARATGIGAGVLGVLLLTAALVVVSGGRGDPDARAIAGKLAMTGLPFLLAGAALFTAGQLVAARVHAPSFAVVDGSLAVVLLVAGFLVSNPWAVGVDLAAAAGEVDAASPFGSASHAEDASPLLDAHWVNGTLSAAVRDPVLGMGQNGPGSNGYSEFTVPEDTDVAVIEIAWENASTDTVLVRLDRDPAGAQEIVHRSDIENGGRLEVPIAQPGAYGVGVYVQEDGGAVAELAFTLVVSSLSVSDPAYRALGDAAE